MIARDALYAFLEDLISSASPSDALYEAASFRNLRGSVDTDRKIVRVECMTGELTRTDEAKRSEMNVQSTIQCWVTPSGLDETDLDGAMDTSFDMAKEIHDAIADTPHLDGTVCDAQFREFETGYANLGTARRGVTYLDGLVNQAS